MDRTARTHWIFLALVLAPVGCSTLGDRGRPIVPTAHKTRVGPFLVCTTAKLDADAPVLRQLRALEAEVRETLGVRVEVGDRPVEVDILDDRRTFDHFLTFYYPDLPHRRAFFLADGPERVVYTFFGDRVEEDLRHEATHALLHVAVGDIPLWLDEGLAEFFEPPAGPRGVNPDHFARLPADLAAGWSPDLARLESLRSVRQMTPRDYRESWAWVHLLLDDTPGHKATLLAYLADLRATPDAPPLSRRLGPAASGPMLLAHLDRLKDGAVASAPKKDPTVRLQGAATSSEPAPTPKRRGVLSRLIGLFGP